jgi:Bacterial regulatory proteins, lacI family
MNEDDLSRDARRRGVNQPPTIHDVARLAAVSIGTVSKALNHGGRLKPATRERVIAAAKELALARAWNSEPSR